MSRKTITFFIIFMTFCIKITFGININTPINLKSPTGTETDSTAVIIWDKPDNYLDIVSYDIFKIGQCIGSSKMTNYTVRNLKANTTYSFAIKSKNINGELSNPGNKIKIITKKQGKIYNIIDYGAKGDFLRIQWCI